MNSLITSLAISAATTAVSFALISQGNAYAFSLVHGPEGEVVKIKQLNIAGYGTYDVEFSGYSFSDLFGSIDRGSFLAPTFWDQPFGAIAATRAIIAALGTEEYTYEYIFFDFFLVPISYSHVDIEALSNFYPFPPDDPDYYSTRYLALSDSPRREDDFLFFESVSFDNSDSFGAPIATFSPVPEPCTMLGSGLAMLLGAAFRRKLNLARNAGGSSKR